MDILIKFFPFTTTNHNPANLVINLQNKRWTRVGFFSTKIYKCFKSPKIEMYRIYFVFTVNYINYSKVYGACTNKFSQLFISRSWEQPEQCDMFRPFDSFDFLLLKRRQFVIFRTSYYSIKHCLRNRITLRFDFLSRRATLRLQLVILYLRLWCNHNQQWINKQTFQNILHLYQILFLRFYCKTI